MNDDAKSELIELAESYLAEAEAKVEAAISMLNRAGLEARALDAREALEYIHGALGG